MPKGKKKTLRKTKKKPIRSAKRTQRKTLARKKKPIKSQNQTSGLREVGVIEVDIISQGQAPTTDVFEEILPPDYGGSE